MPTILRRYSVGKDFSEEDYDKWVTQLQWWVAQTMPNVEDPRKHSEAILLAGMNGTKLDGSPWNGISPDFYKRIRQLAGFDLKTGVGLRRATPVATERSGKKTQKEDLPPIDLKEYLADKVEYIKELLSKYPHLESEVYTPKVDELAETIMKSRMLSRDFVTSSGPTLERLNRIRESLHKQIKELMEFLEISPKFIMNKQKESDTADVGSLVSKMESYGDVWQEYERIDALRELLQKFHQVNNTRPDGTPQLNDWEVWHMTRTKPIRFTCRCGEKYTLLDGFTPEEIEEALKQAYEVYGFGLEPIGSGEEHEEDLSKEMMDDIPEDRIEDEP